MIRTSIVAATLAASVGAAGAAEPLTLSCDGPIGKTASHAALERAFGKDNLRTETIDGVEGETLKATVVFPNDPARRVEVLWGDEKARAKPANVTLRNQAKGSIAGISVGLDVAAVEKLNGRAFVITGFGWDMGGNVVDWKGGALSKIPGGCHLSVQFGPDAGVATGALDKASGDRRFSSADKPMRATKPTVTSVSIGWAVE